MMQPTLQFCLLTATAALFIQCVLAHEAVNPLSGQQAPAHQHGAPVHVVNSGGAQHHNGPPVGHGAPGGNRRTGHSSGHQGAPHHAMDSQAIRDPEHIKEHMEGKIDTDKKLSDEELHFHYFKSHDYDNNNMLDGLEIISALTHHEKGSEAPEVGGSAEEEKHSPRMTDEEISETVDGILQDNDVNLDGYIDYPEFILASQKT